MSILSQILLAFGGITLFLIGLANMSENMENLAGQKMKGLLEGFTQNKFSGVLTGALSTAVIQSSIATNMIVVGFVSNGIMSFYQASSIVMGANIGTTITAQLVALSGKNAFDITAFGSLIAFIGFLMKFSKNRKVKAIGGVMVGFGMLFFGLDIIENSILFFKNYPEFRNIFLVDSDFLLLLNGLLVTSVIQSSSAVTSVMIILASNGLLTFENSMFLILGANIGTCLSVIVASLSKSVEARRTAFFNFAFNVVGAIILFVPLSLFKEQIANFFASFSRGIEREIANFHTLFNLTVTFLLLPILKPFTEVIKKIIPNDKNTVKREKKQPLTVKNMVKE